MHNNVNRAEIPTPQHLEMANRISVEIIDTHSPMEIAEIYQLIKNNVTNYLKDKAENKEVELRTIHQALETIINN